MPLFRHKSDEEKRQEDAQREALATAQRDQQASIASLEAGGIPVQAERRLTELRSREGTFFTSDLSVNEFALARHTGFTPITQVMGSSIYHVGWQRMPGTSWRSWVQSQELTVLSNAFNHSRALALDRLGEEARLAGANAVIGLHVTRARYEWSSDLIEFNTVGTAVRWRDAPPSEHPYLTNLSGQDFWKLYSSGFWPVGIVGGSTVFYVVGGWLANMPRYSWGGWQNVEVTEFSAGVSLARHRALSHLHEQAAQLGASGIVGMGIEHDQEENEVELGNDQTRKDMKFTFHVIGTAITELDKAPPASPVMPAIPLNS